FYTAFQGWSQSLAVLISGLVGFGLANALSAQQLQDFGWRIAFLVGAAIVPFGLVMRRSLPETFHTRDNGKRERVPLRPHLPIAVLGLMMLASGTIGIYTLSYMTTYSIATLHMRANAAFAATIVVGACGVALNLWSGALSDRIGRKPMMLAPSILLLALVLPAFYVITHYPTTAALLCATAVLASLHALCVSPIVTWLTESLPAAIRSGGVAVVYAFSIATFGGSTQYAITWMIKVTGNPLAPAWYWTAAMVVGIVAMIAARESAPCKVAAPGD
ncbi:MAG: MFS transporter, partial [Candidatus Acidiferrales bacterium]